MGVKGIYTSVAAELPENQSPIKALTPVNHHDHV
jgi:hypothetical protein